jgi:hypothetical protein
MTTYILRNDAPKFDTILKKIKTAAKQTRVEIIGMYEIQSQVDFNDQPVRDGVVMTRIIVA